MKQTFEKFLQDQESTNKPLIDILNSLTDVEIELYVQDYTKLKIETYLQTQLTC